MEGTLENDRNYQRVKMGAGAGGQGWGRGRKGGVGLEGCRGAQRVPIWVPWGTALLSKRQMDTFEASLTLLASGPSLLSPGLHRPHNAVSVPGCWPK